ncbi:MAG TPA: LUD domain-containing protein [Anaerolineae bacterium]|nr:LUD domain-containing protein [Anaerolineae bacterium]
MTISIPDEVLAPNMDFAQLASDEQVQRTIQALKANGMDTYLANNGDEARRIVLDLLPDGAEVFTASSQTLEHLGITDEIEQSGRFDNIRAKFVKLYQQNKTDEMRKLGASPDIVVGSVHAITEQGEVLIASGTGSQLSGYVFGSKHVIWVVSTKKLVHDVDEGLRRIAEYSFPLEDARLREAYGKPSSLNKILLINKEYQAGRISVILLKENLGF